MSESPSLPSSETEEIARRVEAELVRLLYQAAGVGLFAHAALAGLAVAGLWAYFPSTYTLGWLSVVLAITAARLALNASFYASARSDEEVLRWKGGFLAGVAASSAAWGAGAWIFLEETGLLPRSLLILILAGLNAGAARSLAPLPMAFAIFFGLTLVPVIARFLTYSETGSWTLAASAVVYGIFLVQIARLQHQHLRRLHGLYLTNAALVARLATAKERAEAAHRAKSDFLGLMGHELRTPLRGVLGTLGLLSEAPLSRAHAAQLETAQSSAQSLLRLFDDLLDLSRAEAGRLTLRQEAVDPRAVLTEVVSLCEAAAAAKGIKLVSVIEEAVPPQIDGDSLRLRQVLLNLVGNAVKFTDYGQVDIDVRPTPGADRLRFSVRDTGIGMSAAEVSQLFETFHPGATRPGSPTGAGLGLAIAQQLVGLMGGRISAESQPGFGSTFSFELPSRTQRAS